MNKIIWEGGYDVKSSGRAHEKITVTKTALSSEPTYAPLITGNNQGTVIDIPTIPDIENLQTQVDILKVELELIRKENKILAKYIFDQLKNK